MNTLLDFMRQERPQDIYFCILCFRLYGEVNSTQSLKIVLARSEARSFK